MNDIPTNEFRQIPIYGSVQPYSDSPIPRCLTGYKLQQKWLVADGESYYSMPHSKKSPTDVCIGLDGFLDTGGRCYQPVKELWRDVPIFQE